MTIIEDKSFDAERAFYGSKDLTVQHCFFDGPTDGESAFKECQNIKSNVEATITTPVISIKNPSSGSICVPAVGKVIRDDTEAKGKIIICEKQSENETV